MLRNKDIFSQIFYVFFVRSSTSGTTLVDVIRKNKINFVLDDDDDDDVDDDVDDDNIDEDDGVTPADSRALVSPGSTIFITCKFLKKIN